MRFEGEHCNPCARINSLEQENLALRENILLRTQIAEALREQIVELKQDIERSAEVILEGKN